VPFSLQKFLISRAVAQSVNSDQESVSRIALVTSMMNLNPIQTALLTRALAAKQPPAPRHVGQGEEHRRR
jgi:hypothetical protein